MTPRDPALPDTAAAPLWLPAEAFYVRRQGLDSTVAADAQVELALEAGAPFALEQLFFGYLSAPAGGSALLFATHRRLFAGEDWADAVAVLPAFLPLVLDFPSGPRVRVWHHGAGLTVAVWSGADPLPDLILSRKIGATNVEEVRADLLAEAEGRLGRVAGVVEEFAGAVKMQVRRREQGWDFILPGAGATPDLHTSAGTAVLLPADVRDRAVRQAWRDRQRRSRLLWRGFALSVAALVLAGLLELVVFTGGRLLAGQRQVLADQVPTVQRIEAAQAFGGRVEELAQRKFRPLEMLAVINAVRPDSVQFLRSTTRGPDTLEIEAQARDSAGVGAYENTLRSHDALARVEMRDLRLRDGLTTFQLTVVFKPDALSGKGEGL